MIRIKNFSGKNANASKYNKDTAKIRKDGLNSSFELTNLEIFPENILWLDCSLELPEFLLFPHKRGYLVEEPHSWAQLGFYNFLHVLFRTQHNKYRACEHLPFGYCVDSIIVRFCYVLVNFLLNFD